jgi:hypothetical protein
VTQANSQKEKNPEPSRHFKLQATTRDGRNNPQINCLETSTTAAVQAENTVLTFNPSGSLKRELVVVVVAAS